MKKLVVSFLSCVIVSFSLFAKEAPFRRGVNITNWFQAESVEQILFRKYTHTDIKQIKSLGFDVIRLPINLHFMTSGAPNYTVLPGFFAMLDSVVSWAETEKMFLIIDNHTFDPAVSTSTSVGSILVAVWTQVAEHYKNHGKYICFEVLNEPHGIDVNLWGTIQKKAIDAIRTKDSTHLIVVGGADWNSYNTLTQLPVYADTNLLYTFHFYDPMLFTHQGAGWVNPSMDSVKNIPFPYVSSSMPELDAKYKGTWIESDYKNYAQICSMQSLENNLNKALQFAKDRNVPIFCGEFGVNIPKCDKRSRANWYDSVSVLFTKHNITWAMWDYHGGFGIFNNPSGGLFESDLNIDLLNALHLNVPTQSPFVVVPDTVGMIVYDDYTAQNITQSASGSDISFMSNELPNNGQYCIRWGNVPRYNNLQFDFDSDKDFTYLKAHSYALDFKYRNTSTAGTFDVRFLDTKIVDSSDRPWRMSYTIHMDAKDTLWHHVHVPFTQFAETGSYDGDWMLPKGLFDWTKIDRLEIVSEQSAVDGFVWFDNILITNLDTALVYEIKPKPTDASLSVEHSAIDAFFSQTDKTIVLRNSLEHRCTLVVYDLLGQKRYEQTTETSLAIPFTLPAGIYFLRVDDQNGSLHKTVKINAW